MFKYFSTPWKHGIISFGSNLYSFGQSFLFAIYAIEVLFNNLHSQSFTWGCKKYAPQSDPTSHFGGCRGGRWGWTVVTLGPRWPLLSHPFVLYIGKTWPSHGPNMAHFKSDVISVKNFKKFKNAF